MFDDDFQKLTGNRPFPWQIDLYKKFLDAHQQLPQSCSLPTGVGKTSIIAVWLLALAARPRAIPRRLVYVVNRRTVVDQTTIEVERIRDRLAEAGIADTLRSLCAIPLNDGVSPLAISTLRGQFADNREWSADPARPAVIVGTVDMIGSRLLFGGYGVGFRSRPLHAGFLGQDVLLVHDEAHLEPAFQGLIENIETEQGDRERVAGMPRPKLRVMALSATNRGVGGESPFELTDVERDVPPEVPDPPTEPVHVVWKRLKARKTLHLVSVEDEKKELADKLVELALSEPFKNSGRPILIFARTVENVDRVVGKLKRQKVLPLTGTQRGLEREQLPRHPIFSRFLPESSRPDGVTPQPGTVYLVCTAAGEVGVNISADHLICDLTTFESMAQRFGRVNRFGDANDTEIHVAHPNEFADTQYEQRRKATLTLLRRLQGDASPLALTKLDARIRKQAFAPIPEIVPTTDVLFDAWSLTTIREKLPGRPAVEPYLHGIAEWEPPETYVAWREEVEHVTKVDPATGELLNLYNPEELLEDFPLKPHELLREPSHRALKHFQSLAKRHPKEPTWLVDCQGRVTPLKLEDLADKNNKEQTYYCTVLLPPSVGGLKNGMLNGASGGANDVADQWYADAERTRHRRLRVWDNAPVPDGMRLLRTIDTNPDADEASDEQGEISSKRFWLWYTLPRSADDDLSRTATIPIRLQPHVDDVTQNIQRIVTALDPNDDYRLRQPLIVAARLHDLGKRRAVWQRSIGNPNPSDWHAKSGRDPVTKRRWRPLEITTYRHELGSLLDISRLDDAACAEFAELNDHAKDLVLHLIATHHGRGRPHFPPDEQFDPEYSQDEAYEVALEVPRRFARLQRKYGRWGLAYIESLLRAADWAASANPTIASMDAS